jgi:hypothetical protein
MTSAGSTPEQLILWDFDETLGYRPGSGERGHPPCARSHHRSARGLATLRGHAAGPGSTAVRGLDPGDLVQPLPHFPDFVAGFGLSRLIDVVYTSALIGFEKPHPEAFGIVVKAYSFPQHVWMIGDNPIADIAGAEAVGIPAILVRRHSQGARRQAQDLHGAVRLIRTASDASDVTWKRRTHCRGVPT